MSTRGNYQAVSLLSSGLDSSLAAALAREEGWDIKLALTFDYGQKAASREIACSARIAEHLGVPHQTIELPWFRMFSKPGGLISAEQELPRPHQSDLFADTFIRKSAASVWVPNRNGVMLEIAAAFAEDLDANAVIAGFNAEEARSFPDNSEDYLRALSGAFSYSTRSHVHVLSPTVRLNKTEIVDRALKMNFPLELIWSCYEGQQIMCGTCESCMRFKGALKNLGVTTDAFFAS